MPRGSHGAGHGKWETHGLMRAACWRSCLMSHVPRPRGQRSQVRREAIMEPWVFTGCLTTCLQGVRVLPRGAAPPFMQYECTSRAVLGSPDQQGDQLFLNLGRGSRKLLFPVWRQQHARRGACSAVERPIPRLRKVPNEPCSASTHHHPSQRKRWAAGPESVPT
ncbi:hypothetical protein EDB81DRAFT_176790 [Dactylonectria macrodidyma]|uniref:Uncharacterized protein n=1 Tax=Dactylonectria macrodidyma TaxID=307937 RepID=A0A9P9FRP3_9HYPO|nr:hypothetical protein EDB81DRAFT_176790 [Dactylonectria macrodidyma]